MTRPVNRVQRGAGRRCLTRRGRVGQQPVAFLTRPHLAGLQAAHSARLTHEILLTGFPAS